MALQDSITYLNDLDLAIQHTVGIEQLKGTTILVTGATGTICLLYTSDAADEL